ncbi:hypothetical protein [Fibrella aquatilis]|nr:hypothetical protein [Fibrella aquatilis]
MTLIRPDSRTLLIQTRLAPKAAQIDVLAWLIQKFPQEAKRLIGK